MLNAWKYYANVFGAKGRGELPKMPTSVRRLLSFKLTVGNDLTILVNTRSK